MKVEETGAGMCPCVDDYLEDELREHDAEDGLKPLLSEVTWADGRVDAVPVPCDEVGIGMRELETQYPSVVSITVGDEGSRTQDSATMDLLQIAEDVFLKSVSGESGELSILRGPIVDVVLHAAGDWDGAFPVWETYLKEVGATDEDVTDADDADEEYESSRWQEVSIFLDESDKKELISRLTKSQD